MNLTPEERVARAKHAEQLMNDSLLVEGFMGLEQAIFKAWKGTQIDQTRHRDYLWMQIDALAMIKQRLQAIMADGRIAAVEIQKKEKDKSRK